MRVPSQNYAKLTKPRDKSEVGTAGYMTAELRESRKTEGRISSLKDQRDGIPQRTCQMLGGRAN